MPWGRGLAPLRAGGLRPRGPVTSVVRRRQAGSGGAGAAVGAPSRLHRLCGAAGHCRVAGRPAPPRPAASPGGGASGPLGGVCSERWRGPVPSSRPAGTCSWGRRTARRAFLFCAWQCWRCTGGGRFPGFHRDKLATELGGGAPSAQHPQAGGRVRDLCCPGSNWCQLEGPSADRCWVKLSTSLALPDFYHFLCFGG